PRRTARARVAVPAAEAALLRATARNCGTTLFGLMLALYFATVHRLTGESDLAIGSLFANRLRPELHNTVGFLANVVVLRTVLSPGATYGTVVRAVHEELREAFVHQQCPLHLLPGDVTARGGRRADETVFQMLPQPLDGGRMGDVGIAMVAPDVESRFDFEATVMVEQGDLALMVLWNEARLSSDWVDRFLREYRASVSAVVRDPGAGVARG
ncbi:MAG: condensation domain-containing protein, partial [Candidatus Eremiobacteraeota bacterium]|nr:condensation domain-containing protein [Candidatus Eremiobacteraeota bacterium]